MAAVVSIQPDLFDSGSPALAADLQRTARTNLGKGAWIDFLPGWISGHQALLDVLWSTMRWQATRRWMYERLVDVPRLFASIPDDGDGHPVIGAMSAALTAHYGRPLLEVSLAAYRDGRDSVAFHGDRLGRHKDDAIVAIASLGEPRRFLLRPAGGGPSMAFALGRGDLLVMGGTCQRTWEHAVPKVTHAGLRMSVQFRSAAVDGEV